MNPPTPEQAALLADIAETIEAGTSLTKSDLTPEALALLVEYETATGKEVLP